MLLIERSSCFSLSCARRVATLSAVRDLNSKQLIEESAVFFFLIFFLMQRPRPQRHSQKILPASSSWASLDFDSFSLTSNLQRAMPSSLPLIIPSLRWFLAWFWNHVSAGPSSPDLLRLKWCSRNALKRIVKPASSILDQNILLSVFHLQFLINDLQSTSILLSHKLVLKEHQGVTNRYSLLTLPFSLVGSVTSLS